MSHIYIYFFVSLNIYHKDTVYYFLRKIYDMPWDFSFVILKEYNCPFIWCWIFKYFFYLQIATILPCCRRGFLYDPCNYKEISLVSEVPHLCTSTEKNKNNIVVNIIWVAIVKKIARSVQPEIIERNINTAKPLGMAQIQFRIKLTQSPIFMSKHLAIWLKGKSRLDSYCGIVIRTLDLVA